jgi:hypothetical protein
MQWYFQSIVLSTASHILTICAWYSDCIADGCYVLGYLPYTPLHSTQSTCCAVWHAYTCSSVQVTGSRAGTVHRLSSVSRPNRSTVCKCMCTRALLCWSRLIWTTNVQYSTLWCRIAAHLQSIQVSYSTVWLLIVCDHAVVWQTHYTQLFVLSREAVDLKSCWRFTVHVEAMMFCKLRSIRHKLTYIHLTYTCRCYCGASEYALNACV